MNSDEKELRRQASRLHHLGMRYIGAFAELAQGKEILFVSENHPGVKELRDLTSLVLLMRAEINGMTNLLVKAGILNSADITREFTEQYKWFADQKAEQFGLELTDIGIRYKGR